MKKSKFVVGVMGASQRGGGYVVVDGRERDVMIRRNCMGKSLHGDRVSVELSGPHEGRVVRVLERRTNRFSGIVEMHPGFAFVRPDDKKVNAHFYVSKNDMLSARDGDKVIVELSGWTNKGAVGCIVQVLGRPGDNETEARSILYKGGIESEFPADVEDEVSRMDLTVSQDGSRLDLRGQLTITIDPEDAKDFDDAISWQIQEDMSILWGVHIADVSHYVRPGTPLDNEAAKRGNSTYLVDRVIPMLPEVLSNGACSLRPDEDKYAMSCMFRLSHLGEVIGEPWIGRTLIRSDRRYTYEEAQSIIENTQMDDPHSIRMMDRFAKAARKLRLGAGALGMESKEVRFKLDDQGEPIGATVKQSKDSNQLVEEFMLIANKLVAERLTGDKKKSVYRVHDQPDPVKVDSLVTFMQRIGHPVDIKEPADVAQRMNEQLEQLRDSHHFDAVVAITARTMAKAKYDTQNIGHYGLGFKDYTHFTSPIRRYADLLVHRLLMGERVDQLQSVCDHISATERKSMEAERESTKFFQAKYMESRIGCEFEGTVSGLTEFGMFVAADEAMCEGLVPIIQTGGQFDRDGFRIVSPDGDYTFGQRVRVRVVQVDVNRRQIDYELIK